MFETICAIPFFIIGSISLVLSILSAYHEEKILGLDFTFLLWYFQLDLV